MECPFGVKPRWARRKDARPQELLAAALDIFVERGFAMTRLEDVARRAGVSKGTLYLYFTNKEELFKAVVRENIVPTLGQAEDMAANHQGSASELLRCIVLGWWERVGNTKLSGITKLMLSESGNFPELARFYQEEVIMRSDAIVRKLLQRGVDSGEFRAELHTGNSSLTKVMVSPILMLMLWQHSFGMNAGLQIDPQTYLEEYLDLCLHGLCRQPVTADASGAVCCAKDSL
ncbi:TetR/AcrR family transcriptional regulator [Massilia sp. W12]|uniref:TetR/AcrR family transcriptional regulator n=1 Tax=Massilia sp. W12 TaxID=3126507 RepID=UPI0030CF5615